MPMDDMLAGMKGKMGKMPMSEEEDSGESMAREEAGNALASALANKDGAAICDAVKTIMDLSSEEYE